MQERLSAKNPDNQEQERISNSQNDNTMAEVKFEDLLGTGAHFGHVTRKWDPNFQPYILLEKKELPTSN